MSPWIQLIRPRTLTGAAAPVLLALAAAWYDAGGALRWLPALLCLLFALLMQMAANAVNDLADARKGRDDEARIGPRRMTATGVLSPRATAAAIALLLLMASAAGLPLAWMGGWQLIGLGAACMLFCVLYSTTLAQRGWGDALVLVFFGLVPVTATYYLQTDGVTPSVVLLSVAMGLVTDLLLIVNNYRDIHQDAAHDKRTIVVRIGLQNTRHLYLSMGLAAVALSLAALWLMGCRWTSLMVLLYVPVHLGNYSRLVHTPHGPQLNESLAAAAKGIILFALITSAIMISINNNITTR